MYKTLAYYSTMFYRSFTQYTTQRLQRLGVGFGSLFILLYVGKHPGCAHAELTDVLHLDWGHSQRSVIKLEKEGFLLRKKTGRFYQLNLTPKGQEAFTVSHQVFHDWDEKIMSALTPEEQSQFFLLLEKIHFSSPSNLLVPSK